MRRRILGGAILVVVGLAAWFFLTSRPVLVDVAAIERGPIRAIVEEEGRTRVRERFVVSAPVPGRLFRVTLEEGDRVEVGAELATIDPIELRSRVEEAEARIAALRHRLAGVATFVPTDEEIERAEALVKRAGDALVAARHERDQSAAAHRKAELDRERVAGLVKSRTAPQEELDAAEAAYLQARAGLEAAEARIEMRGVEVRAAELEARILADRRDDYDWQEAEYAAEIDALGATLLALRDALERTRIVAPVGGTVLAIHAESEQVLAAGAPILEIGNLGELEAIADFLSEDAAHFREGMKAELFGRALGDRIVPATVFRVYPSAFEKISSLGVEQQRVNVLLRFDEGAADVGDQYRVEVRVILEERADAVLVPEGALFRLNEEWHVFKVVDGKARLTPVTTGIRDGRRREVLEGLSPGDQVILHPDDAVSDGAPVTPLD